MRACLSTWSGCAWDTWPIGLDALLEEAARGEPTYLEFLDA
ncbi:hypothetical protein [Archangium violaceum]|nr:hypothetical protein [Archangium violaceum]